MTRRCAGSNRTPITLAQAEEARRNIREVALRNHPLASAKVFVANVAIRPVRSLKAALHEKAQVPEY